ELIWVWATSAATRIGAREEIVAVAWIKPDHVGTGLVGERRDYVAGILVVNDDRPELVIAGIIRFGTQDASPARRIAAEENLRIRADRHPLRSTAALIRARQH